MSRVYCSVSYQAGDDALLPLQGTDSVVAGPDCPVHAAPMHRAPAVPARYVHWVCHGWDGEGCDQINHQVTVHASGAVR